ncbi:hypothetical protein GCM10008960_28420 [Deinococcus sedimenti]|uniref:Uncharacterized protein n=1 Tax=Deinococcus sedimenti TaxID=1867090 RepID=A0ABQ2S5Q4_9DEIO|nr:hypothetical protein GCM10008960_28420 [Deinococcus sedimenti]
MIMCSLCAGVWARRESGGYVIWPTWNEGRFKGGCMSTQQVFTEGLAYILPGAYSVVTGMEVPMVRLLPRTDGPDPDCSPLPRRRERFSVGLFPRRFGGASRKSQKVYTVHILFSG